MRILFVSAGSQATVYAIAPLATAARNAGHEVFMTSNDDMVAAIVAVGLPAISVSSMPLKHFVTTDRAGQPVGVPRDPAEQLAFTGRWFGRLAAATLQPLLDLARDWRPEIVVGGTMSYAAALLAAHLGVPYVRQAVDTIEPTDVDLGAAEELQPELGQLALEKLPEPDLFVDICPPSLRSPGAPPAQLMRWIPGNRQRELEPWMYARGDRARVCVTLGSRVALTHNVDLLRDLAVNIASLGVEVVVAAPEDVAAGLRASRPDMWAGWVPLDVVAPTCDLIVHHGGGVTLMTALNAGVPQLLLPNAAYSIIPCERVSEFGAAITLRPGAETTDAVTSSCRELLSNATYRDRSRAIAHEIAALLLPHEVVDIVEKLTAGPAVSYR